MLKFSEAFDLRPFFSPKKIARRILRLSGLSNVDSETARMMLIFSTSKQQGWLVLFQSELYCLLDDRRKENITLRWSFPVYRQQNLETTININRAYSKMSAQLDFGEGRKALLSKKLFTDTKPEERIRALLSSSE